MQRVQRDDAPEAAFAEPVDRLVFGEHAEMHEHRIERAVLPEHLADADRANERRQNHRDEDDRGEQFFAGEFVAVRDERERQRDGHRGERTEDGEEEGIPQAFEVNPIAKNLGHEIERPLSIRIEKRAANRGPNRPEKKRAEERGGEQIDEPGEGLRHALWVLANAARKESRETQRATGRDPSAAWTCWSPDR